MATKTVDYEKINLIGNREELLKFLDEKLKDYPQIVERNFITLVAANVHENTDSCFRVMQWNMLARALCTPDAKSAFLPAFDWPLYRVWRTLQELVRFDADIMCVQEIDAYEEIKPYLHSIGYTSVFMPKYQSPCLSMENNVGPDGCAIFYRLAKFQVHNMSCEKIVVNNEPNSQVFIVAQLKHVASGRLVSVCVLHLKSKVEWHEKREAQIKSVLDKVKAHLRGSTFGFSFQAHPLLMCGDFNGEPFENFYKCIVDDAAELGLKDAYTVAEASKEPTTIKMRHSTGTMLRRAIDYVFFNTNTLELLAYAKLPQPGSFIYEHGLPNLIYSSDHLSLVCDFKFKNSSP